MRAAFSSSPSLLILPFSVSLRRLSRSVWITDAELFGLDFIPPIPTAVKRQRRRSQSATAKPHPHPGTPPIPFFPPLL